MAVNDHNLLREQLLDRRNRLNVATSVRGLSGEVTRLMREIDAALDRMERGAYGLCEVCHDPIESERLISDPLSKFCLGHLTPSQQAALESDLELAAKVQRGLLPEHEAEYDGWKTAYHYEPAGYISGDYCDLVSGGLDGLYFILGDVSGKGVAASMLMVHLHAMFRTLISLGLPLPQIVEHASRIFCESTMPSHYATLVFGKVTRAGRVELCNAGHLPPLLIRKGEVADVAATALPLGMFCDEKFSSTSLEMNLGDTLLLYTDGLSEAQDETGNEYGRERLMRLMGEHHGVSPKELIDVSLNDLAIFLRAAPRKDDLTIMAIRRSLGAQAPSPATRA